VKGLNLKRKVDTLSEKIRDAEDDGGLRFDFDSFSDAEKLLFRKVDEIIEEYERTGNEALLLESADLIYKNIEVILKRVTELYCKIVPLALGCSVSFEVAEYFFKLHFYNFEADLSECLNHARTWSDKDREFFLADLRRNGAFFFRVPRGFTESDGKNLVDPKNSEHLALEEEEKDGEKK